MARKKNVKYTAEDIEGWLQKMMGILQHMIDSREEWGRIGIIFAYAKEKRRLGENGAPVSEDTLGGYIGNRRMASCALESFIEQNSDLRESVTAFSEPNG